MIINNKHDLCELTEEIPNNLRFRILRNQEQLEKPQYLLELKPSTQSFSEIIFFNKSQKLPKNSNFSGRQLFSMVIALLVKRYVVISNKHGIYELPHNFHNTLRLRIFGCQGLSRKYQNCIELQLSDQFPQLSIFFNTCEIPFKDRN